MDDNKLTMVEAGRGYDLVAKTYLDYEKLARQQMKIDNLPEEDFNDVIIGLLVTKILVLEGKLDEKYWKSAIS